MKEYLEKINQRLEEMYPSRNPTISIFGDESWMVEVDSKNGKGRIGGEISGDSIKELEEWLGIKL